jgi:hypothetical protein
MFTRHPGTGVAEEAIQLVRKEDHDVLATATISNIMRAIRAIELEIQN